MERKNDMKHAYYGYTKEELLNNNPKLPVLVMEDNEAVFRSMAEEMAEEIKAHNEKGEKTVFDLPGWPCWTVSFLCGKGKQGENQPEKCVVYQYG